MVVSDWIQKKGEIFDTSNVALQNDITPLSFEDCQDILLAWVVEGSIRRTDVHQLESGSRRGVLAAAGYA